MLYVGHFSFPDISLGSKREPWHGHFTCVAEAKTPEKAVIIFERLIRQLAKDHDMLAGVTEIYLDSCVELGAVPRTGVLTQISLRAGEDDGGISANLLGTKSRSAAAYRWMSTADLDNPEAQAIEPFITLGKRPARKARKK